VRWEETLLTERIGESYRRYMQRVPRWLPSLGAVPPGVDGDSSARVFSWGETFYSERGTLIAIAIGYLLLVGKGAILRFLVPGSGFRVLGSQVLGSRFSGSGFWVRRPMNLEPRT